MCFLETLKRPRTLKYELVHAAAHLYDSPKLNGTFNSTTALSMQQQQASRCNPNEVKRFNFGSATAFEFLVYRDATRARRSGNPRIMIKIRLNKYADENGEGMLPSERRDEVIKNEMRRNERTKPTSEEDELDAAKRHEIQLPSTELNETISLSCLCVSLSLS